MAATRRVVVDAGVLVSGLISSGGTTARLLSALHTNRFTFVASPHLLSEVSRVLARDRFRGYITLDEALEFVSELHARAELFDDPVEVPAVGRDPDDDRSPS